MIKKYSAIVLVFLFMHLTSLCMFDTGNIVETSKNSYYFSQGAYSATLDIRYNEKKEYKEESFRCYKWPVDQKGARIGSQYEMLDRRMDPEFNKIYDLMISFCKKDFHAPLKIKKKPYKTFFDIEVETIDE